MVQSRIFRENVASIEKSKIDNSNQDKKRNVVNGISVAKALLSPRREGSSEPLPALFPVNYYDSLWKMSNPKKKVESFRWDDPLKFVVSLPSTDTPEYGRIASIMQGSLAFFDQNPRSEIEILSLRTNFNPSYREALSIDVQAKLKGEGVMNARINLAPVAPSDVKIQYKRSGESEWRSIPNSLNSGDYDFRVLASGIAFDGIAYLNGMKIAEFGGFDPSGRIRHKAVSYSSVDEEIGRFSHPFRAEKSFDNTSCKVVSGTGSYVLNIVVNGPAGTDETSKSRSVNFNVVGPSPELKYDEYMSSCKEQCPYLAPPEEGGLDRIKYAVRDRDTEWKKQHFGDYTIQHFRDHNRFELGAPDVRLCADDTLLAEEFKQRHGRYYVSDADYYSFPDFEQLGPLENFIAYVPPACERKFVFKRNSCGCFDSSTRIRLGNNRDEKAISELTSEDRVWNPVLKRAFRIRKMVRGGEKIPMIRIDTDGRSVNVTRNHPMLTPRGVLAAFELSDRDQVMIDGDAWSGVVRVSEIPFEGEEPIVWNLELESSSDDDDSHFVLANGMVTGDLFIQKKIESKK